MLATPPPELLREILLFSIAPPPLEPLVHEQRIRHLRACCLVSKQLHALAQPLLEDTVFLRTERRLDDLVKKRGRTRTAVVELDLGGGGPAGGRAMAQLSCLPAVEDVTLLGQENLSGLGLSRLTSFATLRHLNLTKLKVTVSLATSFPSLESLSLNLVDITRAHLAALLSSSTSPTLVALAVSRLFDREAESRYFPSIPPALADKLDVLQISALDRHLFPSTLFSRTTFTVVCTWNPQDMSSFDIPLEARRYLLLTGVADLSTEAYSRLPVAQRRELYLELLSLVESFDFAGCDTEAFFLPLSSFHPSCSASLDPSFARLVADLHTNVAREPEGSRPEIHYRRGLVGADQAEELGVCREAWAAARRWQAERRTKVHEARGESR
ncbi:hypothetical protein JCM8097_005732 [Rhodosporidiobolus ruineniae]